jgi:hypothetical protein
MFNKLLIKALKKRFCKFSPEEKQDVRNALRKNANETMETKQKKVKRRKKKMADEKEVKKEEVETSTVEPKKEEVETKAEEVETVKEDKKEDVAEEPEKDEAAEEPIAEEPTAVVQETTEPANAIRIEDLVTKEVLADRLAALEAKLDAVVKENEDLKTSLSSRDEELNGMKDKYENKDFGNFQKQGVMQKDKHANSSYEEYSKAFM